MAQIGTDIEKAKAILSNGELVGIPTETVYGLAGNALNEKSIHHIYKVKDRPTFNPLILHIGDISDLKKYAHDLPSVAQILAEKFWPGPLTLVLPKKSIVPDLVTSGLPTVAIRMPSHPLTSALLKEINFPLAAPSANPFGYISPTTASHVADQLGNKIPYILDGGACNRGIESTIIGFEDGNPVLYRLGAIAIEEIQKVVGHPLMLKNDVAHTPLAPGMLPFHYSPFTNALLTNDIAMELAKTKASRIGIISMASEIQHPSIKHTRLLSMSRNLREAASKLYAALRSLDQKKLDLIIIEKMPDEGLGKSINDRLAKAVARSAMNTSISS